MIVKHINILKTTAKTTKIKTLNSKKFFEASAEIFYKKFKIPPMGSKKPSGCWGVRVGSTKR